MLPFLGEDSDSHHCEIQSLCEIGSGNKEQAPPLSTLQVHPGIGSQPLFSLFPDKGIFCGIVPMLPGNFFRPTSDVHIRTTSLSYITPLFQKTCSFLFALLAATLTCASQSQSTLDFQ